MSEAVKRIIPSVGKIGKISRASVALAAVLFLASCAETELGAHMAKSALGGQNGQGVFKVGNPYQVAGVWYYPQIDEAYDSTGIASWYGAKFHGRPTANGEIFDQNALTAAHPTLPLPVLVRVTNLENGRSLVVRVNDRGPFAHGREIDLSRRAADLLGFLNQGTAKVRVQYVSIAPRLDGGSYQVSSLRETFVAPKAETSPEERTAIAAPVETVSSQPLAPPPGGSAAPAAFKPAAPSRIPAPAVPAAVTGDVEMVPVSGPNRIYIQAGAFQNLENAESLRRDLSGVGSVEIKPVMLDDKPFYRVRVGPVSDVAAADTYLERVINRGHPGARIVID